MIMTNQTTPEVVLISDIHFNMQTLKVATAALRQAVDTANELELPLIIAGDLHDTKANIRAECIKEILDVIQARDEDTETYILVGNHDRVNERSSAHALEFLKGSVTVIEHPVFWNGLPALNGMSMHLIPYQHDLEALRTYLKKVDPGSTIIMHQGIEESHSGDYIQDKTAITKDDVKDFRVISGHYHRRQDIKTGRPRKGAVGLFSYIGNPFTLGFGEAEDPSKGFQILMSDGTLKHVPTNLRRHKIFDFEVGTLRKLETGEVNIEDIIWVKVRGPSDELAKLTKIAVTNSLGLAQSFRLDLIPTEAETTKIEPPQELSQAETFDRLIDSRTNTSLERKTRLKDMWKNFTAKG